MQWVKQAHPDAWMQVWKLATETEANEVAGFIDKLAPSVSTWMKQQATPPTTLVACETMLMTCAASSSPGLGSQTHSSMIGSRISQSGELHHYRGSCEIAHGRIIGLSAG